MSFWGRRDREPEPVPAAEVADFGQLMLRQRDKAESGRAAAVEHLAAARHRIGQLEEANRALRECSVDRVALDMKRQSDQDRLNAVRLAEENQRLREEKEAVEHRLAWVTGRADRLPAGATT